MQRPKSRSLRRQLAPGALGEERSLYQRGPLLSQTGLLTPPLNKRERDGLAIVDVEVVRQGDKVEVYMPTDPETEVDLLLDMVALRVKEEDLPAAPAIDLTINTRSVSMLYRVYDLVTGFRTRTP